jgi:hypothetical protein
LISKDISETFLFEWYTSLLILKSQKQNQFFEKIFIEYLSFTKAVFSSRVFLGSTAINSIFTPPLLSDPTRVNPKIIINMMLRTLLNDDWLHFNSIWFDSQFCQNALKFEKFSDVSAVINRFSRFLHQSTGKA